MIILKDMMGEGSENHENSNNNKKKTNTPDMKDCLGIQHFTYQSKGKCLSSSQLPTLNNKWNLTLTEDSPTYLIKHKKVSR